MRIAYISMMITLKNGEVVAGMMSETMCRRWLSDAEHQGHCAAPMAAIQAILNTNECFLPEPVADRLVAKLSRVEG